MKALVKEKPEPGLWLEEQPMPEIGPDDVLVKVHKTGICGTDIHIFNWDDWAQKTIPTPMTGGHEYSGEIAEVGANVRRLKVGQRGSGEGPGSGAPPSPGPSPNMCGCRRSTPSPCPATPTTSSARSSLRSAPRSTPRL